MPTFDEVGVKGHTTDALHGLLAPTRTPTQILPALRRFATDFSQAPDTQDNVA